MSAITNTQPSPQHHNQNRKPLLILTLVFIAIGIIWAALYFGLWQHQEESENAYVNGHMVQINAQLHGKVINITVDDTDQVKAGDILLELDSNDAQLALEKAKSQLIQAVRQHTRLHSSVNAASAQTATQTAEVKRAQVALIQAEEDLKRREKLRGSGAISTEEFAHAKATVDNARATLNKAQAASRVAKAQEQVQRDTLGKPIPLEQQPEIITASSQVKEAWLALQRTKIRAPISGQIARRSVQIGQQISASTPLMAIVPMDHLWVDVNFKETQLAHLKVGQPVKLTSDLYGDDIEFTGTIKGFSAGTGSAFSLLPAQNATGNWIKVVQRIPVRVTLNPQQLSTHPLRIGLSMHALVDTRDQTTQQHMQNVSDNSALSIPIEDLTEADKLVADILANNR